MTGMGVGYPGMLSGQGGATLLPGGGAGTMPAGTFGVPGMMSGAVPPAVPSGLPMSPTGTVMPVTGQEESYVENILRMNLGKVATIYMTFENNCEWNAKIFKGLLEAAGRDHIIISDPTSGKRYLLLTVNLDYITFDQPLVYTLPFGTAPGVGASSLTRQE
ncbi:spore coat protein GerQ [Cohnella sp. CFH 77786]|nr:spore coat protein GerQ [Cohnella sp. CFH 77786]